MNKRLHFNGMLLAMLSEYYVTNALSMSRHLPFFTTNRLKIESRILKVINLLFAARQALTLY